MAKAVSTSVFLAAVEERFAFLSDEGFVGPVARQDDRFESFVEVSYAAATLAIRAFYDRHEGRISVRISGTVDGREREAPLDSLYVEAGLGPTQDVKEIARSQHSLERVLESVEAALKRLLPLLQSSRRAELLLVCGMWR
jgi:hypothetical protein